MKKHKILTAAVLALCIGAMPLQVLPCSVPAVTVAEDSETPETIEYNGMTFEIQKKTVEKLVMVSCNTDNLREGEMVGLPSYADYMKVIGVTNELAEKMSGILNLPYGIRYFDEESLKSCERMVVDDATYAILPEYIYEPYLTSYSGNEEDLTIPETVDGLNLIGIKQGAFQGNTTIKNVTLPDTMEYIESDVFADCTSLETINIPESLHVIPNGTFRNCPSLNSRNIELREDLIISKSAFDDSFRLPLYLTVYDYADNSDSCYNITVSADENGDDFITLEQAAFFRTTQKNMKIIFPETINGLPVKNFGTNFYFNDDNVSLIEFPESLDNINTDTFNNRGIEPIIKAENAKITNSAFSCTGIKELYLKNPEQIGKNAFSRCNNLKEVVLNNCTGNLTINNQAFANDIRLKSFVISGNLDTLTLGENLFQNCTALEEIIIPETCKEVIISKNAFSDVQVKGDVKIDGNGFIGVSAFQNCPIESVAVNGDAEIKNGAFMDCKKLTSVSLPSSIKTLGSGAFRDTGLQSITVPSSVTQMGSDVFENCASLKKASLPDSITQIGDAKMGDSMFENCKALVDVKLPAKLTALPDETFKGCSELTGVNLPNTLTSIGGSAFYSCTKLASLIIPDGVKTIGGYAFSDCSALRRVYMPKNLTLVRACTFRDCRSLLYVNIPEGVTGVMESAFESCTSLKSVLLPQSLKTIGSDAFVNCTSLKELQVPAAATNLAEHSMGYHYENFKPVKNSGFLMSCVKDSFAQDHAKSYGLGYETVPARTIRLAGSNRYSTAVEISRAGIKRNGAVVLASGRDYADALAGVPFARSIGAPILLTDKDTLPADTLEEIKRLGAGKVYILGGTSAVSTKVEIAVKNAGCTVERISGSSRFGTAARAAEKLGAPKEIFFVCYNNFADALSVSAAAALKKAPIIYLKKDSALDAETAAYLKRVKGKVANAYVIGGGSVVSDAMMKNAADALGLTVGKTMNRIAGQNRYKTCIEVNKKFASVFTGKNVCIATGADFPDALAGGAFAALDGSPLLLAKDVLASEQTAYLKTLKPQNKYVLGGRAAVPNAIVEKVAAAGK